MKKVSLFILLLLSLLYSGLGAKVNVVRKQQDSNNNDDSEIFVPTKEWQQVKKGQAVPQGLHVRMNMQTGNVEAKLLDEDQNDANQAVSVVEQNDDAGTDNDATFTKKELKRKLKNVRNEDPENVQEDGKRKFRSADELRKEFEDLKMSVKTDMDLLTELVVKYLLPDAEDDDKISALVDIEYLVHQYDNARDFVRMGGISKIVVPALNSTSSSLRNAAANLLGSAMQSNPRVQIAALENGAVRLLLRLVSHDPDYVVRNKALFALSCLVRHFPLAQQKLVEEGGLSVFANAFGHDDEGHLRLQLRIITLLHDLVVERQKIESSERRRQYGLVELEKALVEQGWCTLFPKLLLPPRPDHDVVEKVVKAMLTVARPCASQFRSCTLTLEALKEQYQELAVRELNDAKEEDGDLYFTKLAELVNDLLGHINSVKEEL